MVCLSTCTGIDSNEPAVTLFTRNEESKSRPATQEGEEAASAGKSIPNAYLYHVIRHVTTASWLYWACTSGQRE